MINRVSSRPFSPAPDRRWLVLIPVLLAMLLPATAGAQLLINEIMADPAGDWDGDGAYNYREDEWVEVINTGDAVVDLSSYWLRDEATGQPRLNLSGLLEPQQVAVFFGSDALAWQAESGMGIGALGLNNGGDTIYLLRTLDSGSGDLELEIVDIVVYLDHEAEDDRSSGLNSEQTAWVLFDDLNPYTGQGMPGGTGCAPSPGQLNACTPTPAQRMTFGGVKASYR